MKPYTENDDLIFARCEAHNCAGLRFATGKSELTCFERCKFLSDCSLRPSLEIRVLAEIWIASRTIPQVGDDERTRARLEYIYFLADTVFKILSRDDADNVTSLLSKLAEPQH